MALINTLRKKMGKIVVGFVAFSMFAFILTDLFQSNSALFGGNDTTIAEIADKDISYEQFQEKVAELSYIFAINNGREPVAAETESIREQSWNALVIDNAYKRQFETLGLEVTSSELVDMVQGNNIDPQIKQFFTDPNTGEFDRENVVSFLQSLNTAQPQQRASWLSFEAQLQPSRLITKYQNLLEKTNYITSAEAKTKHQAQNSNMSVEYFYVPFFSVTDSTFTISDSEMQSYLSSHKDEYKREESRNLSYVVVPIQPSSDDSVFVQEEIAALKEGLMTAADDSTFAAVNTDGDAAFRKITDPSLVPIDLLGTEVGTVTEPALVGERYAISKLSGLSEGDEYFVKARHILISVDGDSEAAKATAKAKATSIIGQIQRGGDFAQLAVENSTDQSNANNGGDLGWFGENGSFVQPFKDAAFGFRGTGLLPRPVETTFGFHIIKIDEAKTNKVYEVATIEKELFESDATLNETYRKADLIAANSSDAASLKSNAEAEGLTIKPANNISKNASRVGALADARSIVLWLYNDASEGKISDVKEFDDKYVIAVMTGKQVRGTAKLSQVKNEIENKVRNEKKAAFIKDKIANLSASDFEGMKTEYGTEARTGTADLTLSSNSFPSVGFAPEAVGVAFSLEEGERTAPFDTANGVLVVSASAKSLAEDQEDYSSFKTQFANERLGRKTVIANFPLFFSPVFVPQPLDDAIKEFADIEDKRYKFF